MTEWSDFCPGCLWGPFSAPGIHLLYWTQCRGRVHRQAPWLPWEPAAAHSQAPKPPQPPGQQGSNRTGWPRQAAAGAQTASHHGPHPGSPRNPLHPVSFALCPAGPDLPWLRLSEPEPLTGSRRHWSRGTHRPVDRLTHWRGTSGKRFSRYSEPGCAPA